MTTLDGMFTGTSAGQVTAAEDWLGYKLDFTSWSADRSTWAAMLDSIDYTINQTKGLGIPVHWTIPLLTYHTTLAQAVDHDFDGFWRQAAEKLVASVPKGETIVVRTGEEFNGGWFAWAAAGHEDQFAQAYRNFVDVFRSVSPDFKFEWNIGVSVGGTDLAKAYPGDAYVDYISGDMYWDSKQSWSTKTADKAFAYFETHQYGLNWMADFAAQHDKPLAFDEWAQNGDSAWFIQEFHTWITQHNVAFESYWDSNANFAGEFTDGSHSHAGAEYKELFGHHVTTTAGTDTVQA